MAAMSSSLSLGETISDIWPLLKTNCSSPAAISYKAEEQKKPTALLYTIAFLRTGM